MKKLIVLGLLIAGAALLIVHRRPLLQAPPAHADSTVLFAMMILLTLVPSLLCITVGRMSLRLKGLAFAFQVLATLAAALYAIAAHLADTEASHVPNWPMSLALFLGWYYLLSGTLWGLNFLWFWIGRDEFLEAGPFEHAKAGGRREFDETEIYS